MDRETERLTERERSRDSVRERGRERGRESDAKQQGGRTMCLSVQGAAEQDRGAPVGRTQSQEWGAGRDEQT